MCCVSQKHCKPYDQLKLTMLLRNAAQNWTDSARIWSCRQDVEFELHYKMEWNTPWHKCSWQVIGKHCSGQCLCCCKIQIFWENWASFREICPIDQQEKKKYSCNHFCFVANTVLEWFNSCWESWISLTSILETMRFFWIFLFISNSNIIRYVFNVNLAQFNVPLLNKMIIIIIKLPKTLIQ